MWSEFFSSLRDGERVIDQCTGNGAVLTVALECAGRKNIDIMACGVDSALIAPVKGADEQHRNASFFVRASAIALPFANHCFNAVTSQFGIEYVPLSDAIAESLRVLTRGGRGLFIAHAKGGITVTHALAELADIAELQDDIGIFPAAVEALQVVCEVERAANPSSSPHLAAARRAHDNFHERLARVGDNWQARRALAVFRDCGNILQHTFQNRHAFPVATLVDKVLETEQSVALHRQRLQALVSAALDHEDCEQLVNLCRHHGAVSCEFSALPADDGDDQLAWTIALHK